MARLALGAKCGNFGASGLSAATETMPAKRLSFNNEASAILPMPVAHRPKNWRRVMIRSCSCARCLDAFIVTRSGVANDEMGMTLLNAYLSYFMAFWFFFRSFGFIMPIIPW